MKEFMKKTRGTSKHFTEHELKQLESNPNVQNVTNKSITYAPDFKLAAVRAYEDRQTPMEIFLRAGFNIEINGKEKPKKCLKRWRDAYKNRGEIGVLENQRRLKREAGFHHQSRMNILVLNITIACFLSFRRLY